jgi:hypothetical protein
MILLWENDLINKDNYDEVYDLLEILCDGDVNVLIKDGKRINLTEQLKEKSLKRLEELGEMKVIEKYKARKYILI